MQLSSSFFGACWPCINQPLAAYESYQKSLLILVWIFRNVPLQETLGVGFLQLTLNKCDGCIETSSVHVK